MSPYRHPSVPLICRRVQTHPRDDHSGKSTGAGSEERPGGIAALRPVGLRVSGGPCRLLQAEAPGGLLGRQNRQVSAAPPTFLFRALGCFSICVVVCTSVLANSYYVIFRCQRPTPMLRTEVQTTGKIPGCHSYTLSPQLPGCRRAAGGRNRFPLPSWTLTRVCRLGFPGAVSSERSLNICSCLSVHPGIEYDRVHSE